MLNAPRIITFLVFTMLPTLAFTGGLPTFDSLNWIQNYLTATEEKLQTAYAATQNAQQEVANSHLLTSVNNQVQMIDQLVNQYQKIERQAKWLMGDGKDFSHLLIPAFRPLADSGVQIDDWDDLVYKTYRFGSAACTSATQTTVSEDGTVTQEVNYPLGPSCRGSRSSTVTGLGDTEDLSMSEILDRWYEKNEYIEPRSHESMVHEYDTYKALSVRFGVESASVDDYLGKLEGNESDDGIIKGFAEKTKDADSLDSLFKLNNYILLQLMSVQGRALKLQNINAQYQAELLRQKHNEDVKRNETIRW